MFLFIHLFHSSFIDVILSTIKTCRLFCNTQGGAAESGATVGRMNVWKMKVIFRLGWGAGIILSYWIVVNKGMLPWNCLTPKCSLVFYRGDVMSPGNKIAKSIQAGILQSVCHVSSCRLATGLKPRDCKNTYFFESETLKSCIGAFSGVITDL